MNPFPNSNCVVSKTEVYVRLGTHRFGTWSWRSGLNFRTSHDLTERLHLHIQTLCLLLGDILYSFGRYRAVT